MNHSSRLIKYGDVTTALPSLCSGQGNPPCHYLVLVGLPLVMVNFFAVSTHGFVRREGLGTEVAFEWAFSRVRPLVVGEHDFGAKPLFAIGALEFHCRGILMNLCKVFVERRLEREIHATLRAWVS